MSVDSTTANRLWLSGACKIMPINVHLCGNEFLAFGPSCDVSFRVEGTEAVVEAPAMELVTDEPVEAKEKEPGSDDEEAEEAVAPQEEAREEEGALVRNRFI